MTKLYAYCLIALLAIPSALWAQGNEMYLLNSGMGAGEADNPLEPNSKLTLSALQGALLSPILDLRHAPLDPNANKTLNPATADYQLETFSNATFNTDGSSHTLRGAWAHATADQSTSFGARGNLQLLNLSISVFDHYDSATATNIYSSSHKWFLNTSAGGFYEKVFLRRMDLLASYGGALDLILYDAAFAEPMVLDSRLGGQLSGYGRITKWLGIHKFTGGGMFQYAHGGYVNQVNLGFAGMWVASVHNKIDTKVDALCKVLAWQYMTGTSTIEPLNRVELRLGLGGVYWLSESIGIDAMYHATLLVDNVNVQTFSVGSRFAF